MTSWALQHFHIAWNRWSYLPWFAWQWLFTIIWLDSKYWRPRGCNFGGRRSQSIGNRCITAGTWWNPKPSPILGFIGEQLTSDILVWVALAWLDDCGLFWLTPPWGCYGGLWWGTSPHHWWAGNRTTDSCLRSSTAGLILTSGTHVPGAGCSLCGRGGGLAMCGGRGHHCLRIEEHGLVFCAGFVLTFGYQLLQIFIRICYQSGDQCMSLFGSIHCTPTKQIVIWSMTSSNWNAWILTKSKPVETTYLMVMTLSPDPRCFSTSIWAPDTSRIKLMLQPPRPITRLIADEGTCTFLDLQDTGLQDRLMNNRAWLCKDVDQMQYLYNYMMNLPSDHLLPPILFLLAFLRASYHRSSLYMKAMNRRWYILTILFIDMQHMVTFITEKTFYVVKEATHSTFTFFKACTVWDVLTV